MKPILIKEISLLRNWIQNYILSRKIDSQQLSFRRDASEAGNGVYTKYMTEADAARNDAENSSAKSLIGLVPTMGYLHSGHQALMKTAKQQCDIVVVSIFVNPLQFGANEDLDKYPRNLEGDMQICEEAAVNVIFAPTASEMYPKGKPSTYVNTRDLDRYLCGASRPGHFEGVCTVVSKLFNIVQPDKAFFGRKDIQQLRIIETMTAELNFPVEIIGCDTERAADGLALSSRNSYLSSEERNLALIVPQVLAHIVAKINQGIDNTFELISEGEACIESFQTQYPQAAIRLDYLQIVDYERLQLLEKIQGSVIIAVAIFIGKTRLIDNFIH